MWAYSKNYFSHCQNRSPKNDVLRALRMTHLTVSIPLLLFHFRRSKKIFATSCTLLLCQNNGPALHKNNLYRSGKKRRNSWNRLPNRRYWRPTLYTPCPPSLFLWLTHWNAPTNRRAPVRSRDRGRRRRRRTPPRRGELAVALRRSTSFNYSNYRILWLPLDNSQGVSSH